MRSLLWGVVAFAGLSTLVGCQATPRPNIESVVQAAVVAAPPREAAISEIDAEATVAVRVQRTVEAVSAQTLANIPALGSTATAVLAATSLPTSTLTPAPTPAIGPLPGATSTFTPIPTPTSKPPQKATSTAQPTFTPRPTSTQTSTSTPIPTVAARSERIIELRRLALDLINQDRADHGVPPVALGSNIAAQLHAEDMLEQDYFGHWWSDGRKPYMVYTETGGKSYAKENVSYGGWTDKRWGEKNCDSYLVVCEVPEPGEEVERAEWDMVYDDADSDWGHRDNILGTTHRFVNIGIAWNGRRTVFVQHFEGGDVAANSPPQIGADGTLSLELTKLAEGVDIANVISVYYDPPPSRKTPAQIESLRSYCLGGGFTTDCVGPIARILKPPPPGSYYSDLGPDAVVAEAWSENSDGFSFLAGLGSLATEPGVYTVVVWRAAAGPRLTESILQLSAVQR
ncbi:MAG: hypothetical protein IIC83_04460 [Chloroflexi bacterium]|nr:hypothetical protein [Chloroflexota bacterium]